MKRTNLIFWKRTKCWYTYKILLFRDVSNSCYLVWVKSSFFLNHQDTVFTQLINFNLETKNLITFASILFSYRGSITFSYCQDPQNLWNENELFPLEFWNKNSCFCVSTVIWYTSHYLSHPKLWRPPKKEGLLRIIWL